MKVYYRHGYGQSYCVRCEAAKKWGLHWDCFMFNIEGLDGVYCHSCVEAIASERNEIAEYTEREEMKNV